MNRPVFHYFAGRDILTGEIVTFEVTSGRQAREKVQKLGLILTQEIHERTFLDEPANRRNVIHVERIDTSPEAASCRTYH